MALDALGRGQGYGLEVIDELIRWGFEDLVTTGRDERRAWTPAHGSSR